MAKGSNRFNRLFSSIQLFHDNRHVFQGTINSIPSIYSSQEEGYGFAGVLVYQLCLKNRANQNNSAQDTSQTHKQEIGKWLILKEKTQMNIEYQTTEIKS